MPRLSRDTAISGIHSAANHVAPRHGINHRTPRANAVADATCPEGNPRSRPEVARVAATVSSGSAARGPGAPPRATTASTVPTTRASTCSGRGIAKPCLHVSMTTAQPSITNTSAIAGRRRTTNASTISAAAIYAGGTVAAAAIAADLGPLGQAVGAAIPVGLALVIPLLLVRRRAE